MIFVAYIKASHEVRLKVRKVIVSRFVPNAIVKIRSIAFCIQIVCMLQRKFLLLAN
jgi:hypothetical protein